MKELTQQTAKNALKSTFMTLAYLSPFRSSEAGSDGRSENGLSGAARLKLYTHLLLQPYLGEESPNGGPLPAGWKTIWDRIADINAQLSIHLAATTTQPSPAVGVLEALAEVLSSGASFAPSSFCFREWQRYSEVAQWVDAVCWGNFAETELATAEGKEQCLLATRVLALAVREACRAMTDDGHTALTDLEQLRLIVLLLPELQQRFFSAHPSLRRREKTTDDHREAVEQSFRLLLQYYDPELGSFVEGHRLNTFPALVEWAGAWFGLGRKEALNEKVDWSHISVALPLLDYVIVLEKRLLLPYAALGLLLLVRRAILTSTGALEQEKGGLSNVLVSLPSALLFHLSSSERLRSLEAVVKEEGATKELPSASSLLPFIRAATESGGLVGSVSIAPLPSPDQPSLLPFARVVFQNAELLFRATPLSMQRALQYLWQPIAGSTAPPPADPPHLYEDPTRLPRDASFYAQHFASQVVLPIEDVDLQQSLSPGVASSRRLPFVVLDGRPRKAVELARLNRTVFIGDAIRAADHEKAFAALRSRCSAHRGCHLTFFGASSPPPPPEAGAGSGSFSTDDEQRMLLAFASRLCRTAFVPFVSWCVGGMEGLRRLVYHRKLILQRGRLSESDLLPLISSYDEGEKPLSSGARPPKVATTLFSGLPFGPLDGVHSSAPVEDLIGSVKSFFHRPAPRADDVHADPALGPSPDGGPSRALAAVSSWSKSIMHQLKLPDPLQAGQQVWSARGKETATPATAELPSGPQAGKDAAENEAEGLQYFSTNENEVEETGDGLDLIMRERPPAAVGGEEKASPTPPPAPRDLDGAMQSIDDMFDKLFNEEGGAGMPAPPLRGGKETPTMLDEEDDLFEDIFQR